MKRYIKIYSTLLRLNLLTLIIYPANFYNSLIAAVVWGFFSLYSIVLLTEQTNGAFGWTRNELLLLNGVYGIIIGIFHVIFSRNFERFSSVIHNGNLDSVLLKPISSQFLLSFWLFGWVSLSRVIISFAYVCLISQVLMIRINPSEFFILVIVGIFSILLLYSIWYVVITLTIWFTRLSNLVELMFNITGIARYPRNMLSESAGFMFWFIFPLLLIINLPTKIYLKKIETYEIVMLISLSLILFLCSRLFWQFALRSYSSASS